MKSVLNNLLESIPSCNIHSGSDLSREGLHFCTFTMYTQHFYLKHCQIHPSCINREFKILTILEFTTENPMQLKTYF